MARKDIRYNREASDEAYNARRRFARKAERYAKKAESAQGVQKARYLDIARESLSSAVSTYEEGTSRKEWSKKIRELDEQLKPVDVFSRKPGARISKTLQRRSIEALSSRDEQMRRDKEARAILSGEAGHRIYAGTIDVWQDSDYPTREEALIGHFGVSDLMEVIEMFEEEIGEDLYAEPRNDIKYDEIVGLIASYV